MAQMKLPPGATLVDDGSGMRLPPGATLVSGGEQQSPPAATPASPEPEGLLSRAWKFATRPLAGAGQAADEMREASTSLPNDFSVENPKLSGAMKGLAGAGADILGMGTSPLSLATAGTGMLARGTGALARLAGMASKTAGVGFGLKGVADVTDAATNPDLSTPDRVQQGLFGGAMMAGGRAGATEQPKYGDLARRVGEKTKSSFNKTLVPGSATELLVRATKPNVGLGDYEDTLNRTVPTLFKQSVAANQPITSLKTLTSAADTLRDTKNTEYQALKSQAGNAPVPTYSVARAQMDSIPATDEFENSAIVPKTKAVAKLYNTTMPVEKADAIRQDTNAKLRGFYNKAGGDQNAALSNPETARVHAVNSGVRNSLYDTIDLATGVRPEPIQQAYGDAVDIGDTAGRRNTIFSRQQPIPLAQQLSEAQSLATGKIGQAIVARVFKKANDSNWLTKEAFRRYGSDQQKPVAGKMGYGSIAAAVAARRR
jgi:hypothetical protein